MISSRPFPDEEQLGWAYLQLELQEALRKDKDFENARKPSSGRSKIYDDLLTTFEFRDVNQLDQFIVKVNKQADSTDELRELIDNDKRRCAKVKVAVQNRLLDLKQENREVDELITQCTSLHISGPEESEIRLLESTCDQLIAAFANEVRTLKENTNSKLRTIGELQKSYEDFQRLKDCIKIKEQENKLRSERIEELEAMATEEAEKIKKVEEDLQNATDEANKISAEIEAAEQYIETLQDEIQRRKTETEKLDIRKKELSDEIEKVQKRCSDLEGMIVYLNAKREAIIDEKNEWDSLLTRSQWEKVQQCQKLASNKEIASNQENRYDEAFDSKRKQNETQLRNERALRRMRNSKKPSRESFNETFGTIVFDPVHLVSSTPVVSPKWKNSDVDTNRKNIPLQKDSNNMVKISNDSDKTKRSSKKRSRPKGRPPRKEPKPMLTSSKHPRCSNSLNAYDMLDSE